MLAQYRLIKGQVPDAILFYRMGDFYEMFFEDALRAAPILDVQLTSRDKSSENPIPMCGVPHHSAMVYIQKLIEKGIKVAICDQLAVDPKSKGLVRREVTRIVTPSLIANPEMLSETATPILMALQPEGDRFSVAAADLMSGRVLTGSSLSIDELSDLLTRFTPREILLSHSPEEGSALFELLKTWTGAPLTVRAYFQEGPSGAVKKYVVETQGASAEATLSDPQPLFDSGRLAIDAVALKSLEVLESNSADNPEASLFGCIDRCATSMGRRCLKEWLAQPLKSESAINRRLDAVEKFFKTPALADQVLSKLRGLRDLERLATKTALGLAQPPDVVAIRTVQQALPELQSLLLQMGVAELVDFAQRIDLLGPLVSELLKAFNDEVPASYRDAGIFRDDYRPDIAELRAVTRDAKSLLLALEKREKDRTGISSLKVRYNRVFGYGIEVTKTHLAKVPDHFIRRQTLANGERYVTEELKKLEGQILTAEDRLKRLEEQLFLDFRAQLARVHGALKQNARVIAAVDVLISFARIARERGFVRPTLSSSWELEIVEGRHPVVEALLPPGKFVPNDIRFHPEEARTMVITGPNMAGKSTIMRQVALIAILGHAGSFVPARSARVPLIDSIFTRIGSSDDLARGRSTFMVEMSEVAQILKRATRRSLILIDEIGRGTSTYDGLSLAWSLLEHLHGEVCAKTLFATHFHELTALEKSLPGLVNANVLVKKMGDEIVFLHRLDSGGCSQSYGVDVARLAGLPSKVLLRAKDILTVLESQSQRGYRARGRALGSSDQQMGFLEI
ncbi:MAG: DNA mismatch repair protein MutS [Deltaproteobacteria bacterium]|nr:DNA mismatch repair protein MutS [Deltaproteobacteria bacterium]